MKNERLLSEVKDVLNGCIEKLKKEYDFPAKSLSLEQEKAIKLHTSKDVLNQLNAQIKQIICSDDSQNIDSKLDAQYNELRRRIIKLEQKLAKIKTEKNQYIEHKIQTKNNVVEFAQLKQKKMPSFAEALDDYLQS